MKATEHSGKACPAGLYLFIAVVAVLAALTLAAAGFGTRFGIWYFRTGLAILKYAAISGAVIAVIGVASGFIALRREWLRCVLLSLVAIGCGILAFGVPMSWKMKAMRYPRIHDITTDVVTPPDFVAVTPLRGGPAPYGGPGIAALQRQAYPDIRTLVLSVPADQAFKAAVAVAQEMGWQIVATDPAHGRIEATDTTFWFGFKDDVVVRITPATSRSLLDIRSVSRVGISDLGTNAKRIQLFLKNVSNRLRDRGASS